MFKRIFIKTVFLLFLSSNMFANANDVAGLSGVSEAAGNSAQAAADQLPSDAGKAAAKKFEFKLLESSLNVRALCPMCINK